MIKIAFPIIHERVYRDAGLYIRMLVFFTALSITILSILAPLRQSLYGFPNGESIYHLMTSICHQLPSRSFWILDLPFGLCSRCLLGYTGVAIAALFINCPSSYLKRFIIGFVLLLPGIADGLIQLMTSYESTNLIRSVTGFIGGIGFFMILASLGFLKFVFGTRKTI